LSSLNFSGKVPDLEKNYYEKQLEKKCVLCFQHAADFSDPFISVRTGDDSPDSPTGK